MSSGLILNSFVTLCQACTEGSQVKHMPKQIWGKKESQIILNPQQGYKQHQHNEKEENLADK